MLTTSLITEICKRDAILCFLLSKQFIKKNKKMLIPENVHFTMLLKNTRKYIP